jgi:hypothetical protein
MQFLLLQNGNIRKKWTLKEPWHGRSQSHTDVTAAGSNEAHFTSENNGDNFPAFDIPRVSPHSSFGRLFNGVGRYRLSAQYEYIL